MCDIGKFLHSVAFLFFCEHQEEAMKSTSQDVRNLGNMGARLCWC